MSKKRDEPAINIENALNDESLESIYFNGFSVSVGAADVVIVLNRNGKAIKTLNMSYTVAKTLVEKLDGVMKYLEKTTGNKIMTTDNVTTKMKKGKEK